MTDDYQLLSAEEIVSLQTRELQKLLAYVAEYSSFYKETFAKHGIDIADIRSIADLQRIPFTTKEDLQLRNHDFLCVPPVQVIDYITTSGTLGTPVTIALTDKDLDRLATNECNSFMITGGTAQDIYHLMTTIDRQFMAGLAYFLGARRLGAGIIRVGNGILELQWDTIKRIAPTAIICVPSFILKLVEFAESRGIDYKNSSVKKAICIGEPLRNEDFSLNTLGQKIADKWPLELFSTYASSEMGAAFTECSAGNGGHLQPGLVITEVIDENEQPVKPGEPGELVVTTLGIEGMPLLRFRTGDICRVYTAPCACGRSTPRIGPIIGRRKQMIKYRGTTLYPSSLYDILDGMDHVKNYQVEIYTNDIGTDEIFIRVGCEQVTDTLEKELKDHFRAKLRVAPGIRFEDPAAVHQSLFPEQTRKPIKFIDNRGKKRF